MPLFLSILAAAAAGLALHRFGGPDGRPWAVPAAAAILFGGVGHYYDLPDWAVIGGVLIAPFLFHRTVRGRLEKAAKACARLEVPDAKVLLRRVPDYSGKHVALWTAAGERADAPADPHALVLALDFVGAAEDEYEVVVRGESPGYLSGEMIVYHREAQGRFTALLGGEDEIVGLPGLYSDWVLRTLPGDYAFQALDIAVLALIHEVMMLRSERREVYIHLQGHAMRIGATGVYSAAEIPRVLSVAARLFLRLRAPPGPAQG